MSWKVCLLLFLSFCLTACDSTESIELTVQSTIALQVADAVSATLMAIPSATAYATQQSYVTATPYATTWPYPTTTPYSTATPYPTHTPYATFTPMVTAILEPTVTSLPTQAALPTVPLVPTASSTPSVVTKEQMLQLMETARANMGLLSGVIDSAREEERDVDCQAAVQSYESFVPITSVDLSGSSAPVRNAYGSYQAAVAIVIENNALIEDCRRKIATSGSGSILPTAWDLFYGRLSRASTNLAQAITQLQIASDA